MGRKKTKSGLAPAGDEAPKADAGPSITIPTPEIESQYRSLTLSRDDLEKHYKWEKQEPYLRKAIKEKYGTMPKQEWSCHHCAYAAVYGGTITDPELETIVYGDELK